MVELNQEIACFQDVLNRDVRNKDDISRKIVMDTCRKFGYGKNSKTKCVERGVVFV